MANINIPIRGKYVNRYPKNTIGKDYVIGDLHGCYDLLFQGLHQLDFNKETDRLFSVGDIIDRGDYSEQCLSLLFEPWFHSVKGNHEQMMIESLLGDESIHAEMWIVNGGSWFVKSDMNFLKDMAEHMYHSLPLVITVGEGKTRFNIVHAHFNGSDAVLDKDDFDEYTQNVLLWSRSLWNEKDTNKRAGLSRTYCGHSVLSHPTLKHHHYNLDTGAFLNIGSLTFFDILADDYISIKHGV